MVGEREGGRESGGLPREVKQIGERVAGAESIESSPGEMKTKTAVLSF